MLNLLRSHLHGRAATPSSHQPAAQCHSALPCCAADAAANGEKQREGTLPENHLELLPGNHPASIRVRRLAAGLIATAACDDNANYGQLSSAAASPRIDWSVGVLVDDAEYVAGFTTAGGRIWVTRGILRLKDAVVASVLAHEIGHVIARHTERRMSNRILAGFLANFAGELLLDAPPGDDKETRKALRSLFMRPCYYSNEYEADRLGMLLIAAAGYDPRAVLQMQRRLWLGGIKMEENSVLDNRLSRHPPWEERLERLSQAKVMDQAMDLYRRQTARSARQGQGLVVG